MMRTIWQTEDVRGGKYSIAYHPDTRSYRVLWAERDEELPEDLSSPVTASRGHSDPLPGPADAANFLYGLLSAWWDSLKEAGIPEADQEALRELASFPRLVNLTPHEIVIRTQSGMDVPVPPSGQVARVSTRDEVVGSLGPIPVVRTELGAVEGLPSPEEEPEARYIVSGLVLQHPSVRGRGDVFAPDTGPSAIRDSQGQIVAVTRLRAA